MASFSPMAEFMPHQFDEQSTETEEKKESVKQIKGDEEAGENLESYEFEKLDNILHYEHIVEELFSSFRDSYQKNYESKNEHEKRKNIFRHNMR